MSKTTKTILAAAALLLAGTAGPTAVDAAIVLDFEGLQDQESVNEFYNGGFGGNGSGPGTNFGIEFSSNALALIDSDAGGSGNFGSEPTPSTIMFFLSGNPFMNVAAGFNTGFSFFYSSSTTGTINVYDGLNGSGNLLTSIIFPATPLGGGPDPTGFFSPFYSFGVSFSGTAKSVVFGGVQNQVGFDNITFGSVTPGNPSAVPEPSSIALLGTGALSLIGYGWRRRKAQQAV